MVLTVTAGYLPTAVSLEVMVASAPSRTALAQSDASARVGTGELTMGAEDFGSHDDRLGVLASELDAALGSQRDLFERALDGHVATGNHDAVEGLDDLFKVLKSLRLLDLGDDRDATAFLVHDLGGRGRCLVAKRTKDMAMMSAPVRIAQRRSASSFSVRAGRDTATPGRLMPLWLETGPATTDLGVHVVAFDLGDLKTNLAVIDEDRIASMAIARQALERGGSDMLVALDVVGGDDELLAFGQLDLVFTVGVLLEPTATDLRTLQINQGCDVCVPVALAAARRLL